MKDKDDRLIHDLLREWEAARRQGRDLPPAQLCRDAPHLVPELQERIQAVKASRKSAEDETIPPADDTTQITQVEETTERYQKIRQLGEGLGGEVWLAMDLQLQREIALKILSGRRLQNPYAVEQLLIEARAIAKIDHPNVVTVHDVGTLRDGHFIAMQYVAGGSLRDLLKRHGTIPAIDATRIITDSCRGLAAAHQHGIIHRDIKPGNILLTEPCDNNAIAGTAKLADFGLAMTRQHDKGLGSFTSGGTPIYMSPEQWRGEPLDPRTDIYSLGVTWYALLTGDTGRRDSSGNEPKSPPQPLKIDYNNPSIPPACQTVLRRALMEQSDERYTRAEDFLADLESILNEGFDATPARQVTLLYKRGAKPDGEVLALLDSQLAALSHQVFSDCHLAIGIEWAREISRRIAEADAVVVLLSESSIGSEMLCDEVQQAQAAAEKSGGRPRLLPVRINYEGPLPAKLESILGPLHYFLWKEPQDSPALVKHITAALASPPPQPVHAAPTIEVLTGPVSLDNKFYIERQADREFDEQIKSFPSFILIKSARQAGRTSLVARGIQQVRDGGATVVMTDFQKLSSAQLEKPKSLYITLADMVARQLKLPTPRLKEVWEDDLADTTNFENFISDLLSRFGKRVVWLMNEIDRLFQAAYRDDMLGNLRTWAGNREFDPSGPWSLLTVIISYSTEPHLFISNMDQSPFNLVPPIVLHDFTREQVDELNAKYGNPLKTAADVRAIHALTGGQPFLVQRALYEIAVHQSTFQHVRETADHEDGPFGDHLRRILTMLSRDAGLLEVVRGMVKNKPCSDLASFYRLRSAGILKGSSKDDARMRCDVYQSYLKRHLGK